jgi:hypothetical protein
MKLGNYASLSPRLAMLKLVIVVWCRDPVVRFGLDLAVWRGVAHREAEWSVTPPWFHCMCVYATTTIDAVYGHLELKRECTTRCSDVRGWNSRIDRESENDGGELMDKAL